MPLKFPKYSADVLYLVSLRLFASSPAGICVSGRGGQPAAQVSSESLHGLQPQVLRHVPGPCTCLGGHTPSAWHPG
jgi:hypothetical protein